ncbi:MAG: alpha/beta hydrolase [Chloroflexota bacterium]
MVKNFLEKGAGQPVVFLHGIGANAAGWHYQLEGLSDNYRVIALDLPGYGDSDPLETVSFPDYAQWLHEFLTEQQLEQPVLVGNSYGGMITQEYLALYPGRVRAAILTGTSPAFGRKEGEWQQKFINARLGPLDAGKTMVDLAPHIAKGLVGSGGSAEGMALAQTGIAAVPEETFRAAVHCLITFDRRDNLAKIDIPCLLLVGEEDNNAPAPMMEKMAGKISTAQFHCFPKLGHLLHLEDPVQFNQVVRTFLTQL